MRKEGSLEKTSEVERAKIAVTKALQSAFEIHNELGEDGLEQVNKNQFGDTALRADVESEKAVLDSLKKDAIPVRVFSEEHGIVDIGVPEFTAVLDGIDGTALYKKERGVGKYATLFSIFNGLDPVYNDYLVCGLMQHSTGRLFLGIKGQGAFAISDKEIIPIKTSGNVDFNKQTKIHIDEAWETNRKTFSAPLSGFNTESKRASSLYYADVAEGLADFALECTRKGNLEIAANYGLIKEAGGVIVDLFGQDIGGRKYLEFGINEQIPVITASTKVLADKLVEFLKEKKV